MADEGLGSALASLFTRQPDDRFSAADQELRDKVLGMVTPDQLAVLDQTQTELWRNKFQQQMPQSLQGRPSLSQGLYHMPVIDRPMAAPMPQITAVGGNGWVPPASLGLRPGNYLPPTDFDQPQTPMSYLAGSRYGR